MMKKLLILLLSLTVFLGISSTCAASDVHEDLLRKPDTCLFFGKVLSVDGASVVVKQYAPIKGDYELSREIQSDSFITEGGLQVWKTYLMGYLDENNPIYIWETSSQDVKSLDILEDSDLANKLETMLHEGLFALADPSDWAVEDIEKAVDILAFVPVSQQTMYKETMTRADFCELAVGLYEKHYGAEITERQTFADCDLVAVEKMAALGVVNGVGDGKFSPDATLTREQAATMLDRLATAFDFPLRRLEPDFADRESMAFWSALSIGALAKIEVMKGVDDSHFDPQGAYTREQSIITLMRLSEYINSAMM